MSKNKTSKFQYFAILFIHLSIIHPTEMRLRCDKVFETAFCSLSVKTFAYHL